jgi:hypothetical protein
MSKRSSHPPNENQLAAQIVAGSTGEEPENLAERAQHTVTTGETVAVQTERLAEEAGEREAAHESAKEKHASAAPLEPGH